MINPLGIKYPVYQLRYGLRSTTIHKIKQIWLFVLRVNMVLQMLDRDFLDIFYLFDHHMKLFGWTTLGKFPWKDIYTSLKLYTDKMSKIYSFYPNPFLFVLKSKLWVCRFRKIHCQGWPYALFSRYLPFFEKPR